jgi:uncharacterized membrane protein
MGYATLLVAFSVMCLSAAYYLLCFKSVPHIQSGYLDMICMFTSIAVVFFWFQDRDSHLTTKHHEYLRLVLVGMAVLMVFCTILIAASGSIPNQFAIIGCLISVLAMLIFGARLLGIAQQLDKTANLTQ